MAKKSVSKKAAPKKAAKKAAPGGQRQVEHFEHGGVIKKTKLEAKGPTPRPGSKKN